MLQKIYAKNAVYFEIVLGLVAVFLLAIITIIFHWAKEILPSYIILPACLLIAGFMFGFRHYLRFSYSVTELFIGAWIVYLTIQSTPPVFDVARQNQILIQFAAGIYVMVRGFDNMVQSKRLTVQPNSPIARLQSLLASIRNKSISRACPPTSPPTTSPPSPTC